MKETRSLEWLYRHVKMGYKFDPMAGSSEDEDNAKVVKEKFGEEPKPFWQQKIRPDRLADLGD